MKQTYSLIAMFFMVAIALGQSAVITSYVDATCSGAKPRILEIYVEGTINFSGWKIVKQTNGAGFAPGSANRAEINLTALNTVENAFIYATNDEAGLAREFNITTNVIESGNINSNGDDAFQIIDENGTVVDRFGEDGVQANSGVAWRHEDTYVYRFDGTQANAGAFDVSNFFIGSQNLLDNKGDCDGTDSSKALSTIVPLGSYSTTASTTPTIIVSGDVTGLDYFEGNGPSNEETITVSGRNLTNDIVITSTDFELSETTGGTFSTALTLSQNSGEVAATTLYVRLKAGQSAGSYIEDVTFTSGGASSQTVSVAGTVSPATPEVFISGSATGMNYNEGSGPSDEDSFAVSGRFLTGTEIVVTVTAPFELALSTGGTFSNQASIPLTNGTAEFIDVFIRLAAGQTQNSYTGTVTASSTGAADDTIDVNGNVFAAANCPNVGDLIITEFMADPTGTVADEDGEYFEIYNTTNANIDMNGFTIADDGNDSFVVASSVIVPAGGYVVFGKNGNTAVNGGITVDYDYPDNIFLSNTSDEIVVICNGVEIDRVNYTSAFPTLPGISTELALDKYNATDNDDSANWGEATSNYHTDNKGTPGTANNFTLSINGSNKLVFSLYPNPATSGTLNINSSNGAEFDVEVFSTLGQRVISQKSVTNSINIDSLTTGLYIVRISQGDRSQTRKLVVK